MIEARYLTKRYGQTVAVDEASFVVRPGRITGFLGPNGAGKSTTMRMILGRSEVLDIAGLSDVAGQRVGTFSLGMNQMAQTATLEEAFFELTRDETDYRAGQLAGSSKGI